MLAASPRRAAVVALAALPLLACSSGSTSIPVPRPLATTPLLAPPATVPASPPPVPVTDTPAPTFTPAPSATPFPQFFTNEFDSSLEGWVILQAGNESAPNVKNENSRLLLEMDAPYSWVYGLYGAQDYDNVHVDTKFVNNALSPASIGLICSSGLVRDVFAMMQLSEALI